MATYNEISGKLINVTGDKTDPAFDHIVAGTDVIYDSEYPLIVNGYVECNTTPISAPTGNPHEQGWCEEEVAEGEGTDKYILTEDTTVELGKSYYKPIGARQDAINNQLRTTISDLSGVVLHANEYNEATIHEGDNPQANGWYELSGTTYVLTTDTTVVSGKTYYIRVAKITSNEDKIIGKEDGYIPTAGAIGRALGANFEDNLTSTSTVKGLAANQGRVLNEKKADKNGWYEQFVAGASLSVIGDDTDDKAKFFYRETGDSEDTGGTKHTIEKGTATINTIYGNTVKWNQIRTGILIENTWSKVDNADGSFTITALSDNQRISVYLSYNLNLMKQGHKYLFSIGNKNIGYLRFKNEDSSNTVASEMGRLIYELDSTPTQQNRFRFFELTYTRMQGFSVTIMPMIIDLTEIFGAGNEPTTVAEFESWLALNVGYQDYYTYNTGSLISLKPKKLISTGVNLYNPTTGTARVLLGKQYKLTGTNTGATYSDGTAITLSDSLFTASKDDTITINGGDSTSTFLYLVLNNDTSKTFEPYKTNEVDLSWIMDIQDPNDNTKKLFPYGLTTSLSSVKDEVGSTKAVKKNLTVNLGELTGWQYRGPAYPNCFSTASIEPYVIRTSNANYKCSNYSEHPQVSGISPFYNDAPDKSVSVYNGTPYTLYIKDSTLSASSIDSSGKISDLNGVMLNIEIATPITVTFEEPDTHPMNYEVEPGGIEEFIKADAALGENEPTSTSLTATITYPMDTLQTIRNIENNYMSKAAYISSSNSLVSAINGMSLGYTLAFDDTTLLFSSSKTVNTQSVEEPDETI